MEAALELTDWRCQVGELYARIRTVPDPADGHRIWRYGRDRLFRQHPQSPLAHDDPLRRTGLPHWPYDPHLRFDVPLEPAEAELRTIESGHDGTIRLRRIGRVTLAPIEVTLDVWWLAQYAGGLFLPLRDGTAGTETYGGGRYLLDTAKGADLGGMETAGHRSQLRLPPVVPLRQRLGVPARASGQHDTGSDPRRGADVSTDSRATLSQAAPV